MKYKFLFLCISVFCIVLGGGGFASKTKSLNDIFKKPTKNTSLQLHHQQFLQCYNKNFDLQCTEAHYEIFLNAFDNYKNVLVANFLQAGALAVNDKKHDSCIILNFEALQAQAYREMPEKYVECLAITEVERILHKKKVNFKEEIVPMCNEYYRNYQAAQREKQATRQEE